MVVGKARHATGGGGGVFQALQSSRPWLSAARGSLWHHLRQPWTVLCRLVAVDAFSVPVGAVWCPTRSQA